MGSVNTLISPSKLRRLAYKNPIKTSAGLDVHVMPEKGHNYMLVADVSRGLANDYSAFLVIDITELPYKVVAKYRDNEIKPLLFPNKIHDVAKVYNQAFVLVEVNDIGDQVAHTLQFDLEYDNMLMATMRGRAGQILGSGLGGGAGRSQLGVRTTKAVKRIGCSNFKTLLESDKFITEDYDLINEMSTFIIHGSSYAADDGCNDDLVMCAILFSWCTTQQFFKELTDIDLRKRISLESSDQLENDMLPFGFLQDGFQEDDIGEELVDNYGTRWSPVIRTTEDF